MVICMISAFFLPSIGGVEAHIYNISKELINRGNKVIVVNPIFENKEKDFSKEIIDGIIVYRVYLGKDRLNAISSKFKENKLLFLFGFLRKAQYNLYSSKINDLIYKLDNKYNIDLIHQHDFISSMRLSKKLSKMYPIVLTNHTGEFLMLRRNKLLKLTLKYILSHFKKIIGPSKELCDMYYKEIQKKTTYIPNGVDIKKFYILNDNIKKGIRDKYNLCYNDIVITCPRRWAPTKGIKYFAKSIKYIEEKCSNYSIKYVFIGSDYPSYIGYSKEVKNILDNLNLKDKIVLLGDIPYNEMNDLYNISDIIVIPSLMEATSLSALEAMACKKSVVATNIGGLPEIFVNNKNGILVQPKNPKQIAKAIIKLIENNHMKNAISEEAYKEVIKNFTWIEIAKKTENVYKQALNYVQN